MPQPHSVDSRSVLKAYAVIAFIGGVLLGAVPWPVPEAVFRVHVDRTTAWRLLLVLAGQAIVASGMLGGMLVKIEDPIARRRALQLLATICLVAGLFRWSPAWSLMTVVPPAIAAVPVVAGIVMLYLARAPRRPGPATVAAGVVFHDKASLTSRYEQSIRTAARQEERARLARDLHDAVKQQLFVIQTAAATVEQRFGTDPAGAQSALTQVRASARDALSEMEVMLEQLQATPLTNAGLVESLKRLAEVTAFRTGADVRFDPGTLPPEAAFAPGAHQAMLRFAQEALANVARHARATEVTVSLKRENSAVVLSVTDNGQGFDQAQPPRGIGLGSMAARAAEAEGVYSLTSAPGAGTTVSLTIQPYAPDRTRFVTWIIVSAVTMLNLLVVAFKNPGMLVYVVVAEVVLGTVLVDNAIASWRARTWPESV